MAVPTFTRYTQLPIQTEHRWDAEWTIQQALEDLKLGRFTEPALLADAILTDDKVRQCMDTRVNGMLGLGMEFEEEGEDERDELSEARDRIIEIAETELEEILPEEETSEFIAKAHLMGVQVGELVWEDVGDLQRPRLKTWDNQFLFWVWDPTKRPQDMFWLITAEGTINVTPGDGHWVLYAPHGFYYGWRRGLLRNLSRLWLDRAYALRDWARRSERNGLGVTLLEVPQGANQKDKNVVIAGAKRMASEPTLILPVGLGPNGDQKFDMRMVDTKEGEISQFYAEHFKELNGDISSVILGQELTTNPGKQNALGQGRAHQNAENVRRDYLRYDARSWCRFTHDQVFKPWADVNFGNRDLAPRPKIDVEPPEDLSTTADGLGKLATALVGFKTAEAPIDQRKLLDQQGVPITNEAPAAPMPGGTPPSGPQPTERMVALSHGVEKPRHGGRKGQRYINELARNARELAAKEIRPELDTLLAAVKGATSLTDARHRVLAAFHGLPPSKMAPLLEKAMLLAKLSGRKAILEDL